MDDDREAYEFAYALHLAQEVDREAAQMIVDAAEVGFLLTEANADYGIVISVNSTRTVGPPVSSSIRPRSGPGGGQ